MSDGWVEQIFDDEATLELVDLDELRGLGVRALRRLSAGDVIHRFTGKVSDQISLHSLQIDATRHISETRYVGYLTHSCDPNTLLEMANSLLLACRDIAPGDILTVDYALTEDRLHRQFRCACGAETCRRWVTGRRESPNDEGRALLRRHIVHGF